MSKEVPDWAAEKALKLYSEELNLVQDAPNISTVYRSAFARYIAEHEEAPVDPLLIEARNIAAADYKLNDMDITSDAILSGYMDGSVEVRSVLAALRRGIELGKAEQ